MMKNGGEFGRFPLRCILETTANAIWEGLPDVV